MRYKFLLAIILALASNLASAQPDSININPHNPHGPSDTTRLNPRFDMMMEYPKPPIYDTWFKRITDCEGLALPPQEEIDKIQYYVVNAETFSSDSTNINYDAITNSRNHIMVLSLPSVWDYDVVAHEFLHFVLWYIYGNKYVYPPNSHPQKYFGKCGIRSH